MRLTSSGSLGINCNNPARTLDVGGSINYTGDLYQNGTLMIFGTKLSNTSIGYIPFGNGTEVLTSNVNLFWDNTNSRLGLNNASPQYTFDMNG